MLALLLNLPMCDVLAVVPEVVDPKDQKKRHMTHEALLYCSSTVVCMLTVRCVNLASLVSLLQVDQLAEQSPCRRGRPC